MVVVFTQMSGYTPVRREINNLPRLLLDSKRRECVGRFLGRHEGILCTKVGISGTLIKEKDLEELHITPY